MARETSSNRLAWQVGTVPTRPRSDVRLRCHLNVGRPRKPRENAESKKGVVDYESRCDFDIKFN